MRLFLTLLLSLSLVSTALHAQKKDSSKVNTKSLIGVSVSGGVLYGGFMTALSTVWYKDLNQVGFHFKNDNLHWLQIDKFGHAYSSYVFSKVGMDLLKRTGLDDKKAAIWGGAYGFLFLTSVEIIDAHYSSWGFSTGDVVSNAFGSLLLTGQELLFKEQYVSFKYSYHTTEFVSLRPKVFGENYFNQLVADYNGQTYWMSLNLGSLFPKSKYIPSWLCVSGGYGAYGLLSSETNPTREGFGTDPFPEFDRTRHYYLSLDIDFDKIKTKSKVLKTIFSFLNLVKVPFPTLDIDGNGKASFHPLYF